MLGIFVLVKLKAFRPATLLKRDSNSCIFLWNFPKFLRTPILKNICEWLLLISRKTCFEDDFVYLFRILDFFINNLQSSLFMNGAWFHLIIFDFKEPVFLVEQKKMSVSLLYGSYSLLYVSLYNYLIKLMTNVFWILFGVFVSRT